MSAVALAVAAFAVMEPVTYLTHRFVMHGLGRFLHRSHHRRWPRSDGEPFLEANDAYPVVFASITLVGLALGFNVDGFGVLVPLGIGISAYGVTYALVHDGYIHGRIPVPFGGRWLEHLAECHALHHRYGGEPYGMLAPVIPAALRRREDERVGGPSAQRATTVPGP